MAKTVGQLISELERFDPGLIVGIASNPEGTGACEYQEAELGYYDKMKFYGNRFERMGDYENPTAVILWSL